MIEILKIAFQNFLEVMGALLLFALIIGSIIGSVMLVESDHYILSGLMFIVTIFLFNVCLTIIDLY